MKKGFTLVELYNKSKKEIFVTEVKNIYKKVEETYVSTKLKEEHIFRINSEDNTKLDMNGNKLKYCIILMTKAKYYL